MTDRFEDAVRDAVRGLPSAGEQPTYHSAWQRGRRRRIIKRSALAAAGAVVLVAALTVNLGRLPGADRTEVDDVATGAAPTAVVEPTELPTTSPLEIPTATTAPSPVPTEAVAPTPAPEPTADANPTPTPASAQATPAPTAPPTEVPATVAPVPSPTSVATSTPEATPTVPTATPDPAAAAIPVQPNDSAGPAAGASEQPADLESTGGPDEPDLAFTTAAPADATLVAGEARGTGLPCDIDADSIADATCELLVFEYACTGQGDVRPGYTAEDVDGDGAPDVCLVVDITLCDTIGDGQGDTPCIIELLPAPTTDGSSDAPPNESETDG